MRGATTRVEIRGETTRGKRLGGKRLGGETSCDPTVSGTLHDKHNSETVGFIFVMCAPKTECQQSN